MGVTILEERSDLTVIRVTGLLRKAEVEAVQASQENRLDSDARIKLLLIVEQFLGWERGADWGDMNFYIDHGYKVAKIAVVGDPVHEADLLMFLAAGIRPAPVKFFPTEQAEEARSWLAE